MVRAGLLLIALFWAAPGHSQQPLVPIFRPAPAEPRLQLGDRKFALPIIDYRAPDGTLKRGSGIIIGHDVSPNATVGIGFFKMKPKYDDSAVTNLATAGKSKKVSLGFSLKF